jgi:UDP-glucose 4-epimerase
VPNFSWGCLRGEPIEIFGDGTKTRDFVYVEDLCAGIVAALESEGAAGEVFQLGTGVETSVGDLVELVQEATGFRGEVRRRPARRGEVSRSRVDISKARRELGFDPRVGLPEGLARTAAWYRENAL